MIEPVQAQHLMIAAIAGAIVVLSGTFYALLFALYNMKKRTGLIFWAYGAYAVLVAATVVLAVTLNMTGFWRFVIAVMLVGYFIAPRFIWQLCTGTHVAEHTSD